MQVVTTQLNLRASCSKKFSQ